MMFLDCTLFGFAGIDTLVTERCRQRCALKEHIAADCYGHYGLLVRRDTKNSGFCEMCGAVPGDYWSTRPTRPIILSVRPRAGDPLHAWRICDECHEGLRSLWRSRVVRERKIQPPQSKREIF